MAKRVLEAPSQEIRERETIEQKTCDSNFSNDGKEGIQVQQPKSEEVPFIKTTNKRLRAGEGKSATAWRGDCGVVQIRSETGGETEQVNRKGEGGITNQKRKKLRSKGRRDAFDYRGTRVGKGDIQLLKNAKRGRPCIRKRKKSGSEKAIW